MPNFLPRFVGARQDRESGVDMTDQFNTPLTAPQEALFQQWRSRLPTPLQYLGDYDLRGAFLDQVKQSKEAHFTDKFKKPNHPSFSVESQYSLGPTRMGGVWGEGGPTRVDPYWEGGDQNYNQSPFNLQMNALRNGR